MRISKPLSCNDAGKKRNKSAVTVMRAKGEISAAAYKIFIVGNYS
jgi:hypothetical protein